MGLTVRAGVRDDLHSRDIERGRSLRMAVAKLQLGLLLGAAALTAGVGIVLSNGYERLGPGIAAVVATIALLRWRWQKRRIRHEYERTAATAVAASNRAE